MKIAFTAGNVQPEVVTSYVSAFGYYLASAKKKEVMLLQTIAAEHNRGFEEIFREDESQLALKEEIGSYMVGGMDYLWEHYCRGSLTQHRLQLAAETVLYGHLHYISAGKGKRRGMSDSISEQAFEEILSLAEHASQFVLVDAGAVKARQELAAANYDLFVILVDNKNAEFEKLPIWQGERAYLLCDYRDDVFLNMGNLKRYYGIREEELLPLFFGDAFEKACKAGKMKGYFDNGRRKIISENDRYFYQSLEKAAEKMLSRRA